MQTITRTCPGCQKEFRMRTYSFDDLLGLARADNETLQPKVKKNNAELIAAVKTTEKACQLSLNRVVCDTCFCKQTGELAATDAAISFRKRAQACWGQDWEARAEECFEKSNRETEDRTPNVSAAFEWGREWGPEVEKSWSIISGPVGTGKTFLARCILNKAMQLGLSAREIEAAELLRLNNGYSDNEKVFAKILKADVFLIEEVGLVNWTKDALVALRRVIDAAYKNKKRGVVLMTSNLSAKELKTEWLKAVENTPYQVIYESMYDRMWKVKPHVMDGATLRKGAQNNLPGVA